MLHWTKTTALTVSPGTTHQEVWTLHNDGDILAEYPIDARTSKAFDVQKLGMNIEDAATAAQYREAAEKFLYGIAENLHSLTHCPACGENAQKATEDFSTQHTSYVLCPQCGHAYIREQPSLESLQAYWAKDEAFSTPYIDKKNVENRMQGIIAPKVQWTLDMYAKHTGASPRSVADVGAGGGHFVAGMNRAGVNALGYEICIPSRKFAKECFGLELIETDFLSSQNASIFDCITFWGMLEYAPNPRDFLCKARTCMSEKGLLIVEVPRYQSVSTAIQRLHPQGIFRHMCPSSHMNTFSDASLATLLYESGFKPVAAWYFGMDAYELFMQLALASGNTNLPTQTSDFIEQMQHSFDAGRLCDDLIVAAVPRKR